MTNHIKLNPHHDDNTTVTKKTSSIFQTLVSITSCLALLFFFSFYFIKIHLVSYEAFNSNSLNSGITTNFLGMYIDQSDHQWKVYRSNIPILLIVNIIYILISNYIKSIKNTNAHISFLFLSGIIYVTILHGQRILYLLTILIVYYYMLNIFLPYKNLYFIFIWVYPCIFKPLSEIYDGFNFFVSEFEFELLPWNASYNLVLLRMISFGYEKYYSHQKEINNKIIVSDENDLININNKKTSSLISHCYLCYKNFLNNNPVQCQKFYSENVLPFSATSTQNLFTIFHFLSYCFYIPLYFSGPIILYNSFIFQISFRANTTFKETTIRNAYYAIKVVILIITMELLNHFLFLNALLTNPNNNLYHSLIDDRSLFFCSGFYYLLFIWLKFSVIWKFSRLFSLLDSIVTEENMNRCVFNNFCFEDFWREWHRSFNQWLIKYIYVPLGGKHYKIISIWIIFTFVALWHDIQFNLLVWAWGICFALIPEIIFKNLYNKKLKHYPLFRIIKYFVCAIYIILLVVTNLIGFGMGQSGFKANLGSLWKGIDIWFLYDIRYIFFGFIFFVTVQMKIREHEEISLIIDKLEYNKYLTKEETK